MKCVNPFGTGRYKRQAEITLLFQYMSYNAIRENKILAKICTFCAFKFIDGTFAPYTSKNSI